MSEADGPGGEGGREQHLGLHAGHGPGYEARDVDVGGVENPCLHKGQYKRQVVARERDGPAHGTGSAPSSRLLSELTSAGGTLQPNTP